MTWQPGRYVHDETKCDKCGVIVGAHTEEQCQRWKAEVDERLRAFAEDWIARREGPGPVSPGFRVTEYYSGGYGFYRPEYTAELLEHADRLGSGPHPCPTCSPNSDRGGEAKDGAGDDRAPPPRKRKLRVRKTSP